MQFLFLQNKTIPHCLTAAEEAPRHTCSQDDTSAIDKSGSLNDTNL
jgi:hypothetical protein